MPTKHIDDQTWRRVEKETLRAVMASNHVFKETEILKMLILKGINEIKDEEYQRAAQKKKK